MSSRFSLCCFCGWVAGLLVNAAFLAGIVFGFRYFSDFWPLALVLSFLYPPLLFLWIRRFPIDERQQSHDRDGIVKDGEQQHGEEGEQKQEEGEDEQQPSGLGEQAISSQNEDGRKKLANDKFPLALTLLYGMFCLAVGCPGAVLAYLALPCDLMSVFPSGSFFYISGAPLWETDFSSLPPEVQKWDHDHQEPHHCYPASPACIVPSAKFVTLHDVLYFSGTSEGDGLVRLMAMPLHSSNGAAIDATPYPVGGSSIHEPLFLTLVAGEYLCFVQGNDNDLLCGKPAPDASESNGEKVFRPVSNQEEKKTTRDDDSETSGDIYTIYEYKYIANLVDVGGKLWYQQGDDSHNGHAIYSVDPATMLSTLHSRLTLDADTAVLGNCSGRVALVGAFVCLLFLSALPICLVSFWLWWKKGIATSSITLFLGVSLVFATLGSVFDNGMGVSLFFGMYCVTVTPIWILSGTYVLAVGRRVSRGPLLWSVQFLMLCLFVLIILDEINNDLFFRKLIVEHRMVGSFHPWWSVVSEAILILIPMGIVGIVLNSTLVLVEFVIATIVITTSATVISLQNASTVTVISVSVLVVMLQLVAGIYLYRARHGLREYLLTRLTRCTRHICGSANEEEQDATESLLVHTGEDENENETPREELI